MKNDPFCENNAYLREHCTSIRLGGAEYCIDNPEDIEDAIADHKTRNNMTTNTSSLEYREPQIDYIYNLIAFSKDYIAAHEQYSMIDNTLSKMSREERRQYHKENKDILDNLFKSTSIGKSYRGSFTDLDMMVKIIESQGDPYGLCEGYYEYLLIERYEANRIDGCCFGEEGCEIWYHAEYDSENFKYVRIEKPEGMRRLVSFT